MWGRVEAFSTTREKEKQQRIGAGRVFNQVHVVGGSSLFTNAYLYRQDFATCIVCMLRFL
jgi:hypothetical protein